ncbi:MAG TPA: (2Fe-2S)-binding protein [Rhodopila sp.]|uniref:FAD/NAD(P)-dependent oxidoreductase n=1 Tax=Rhodopila sp. TaxID=2480087 RepID=UPI002CD97408|nr:(2Fe-2S)-binding protein [Rhodopila sp.]HVY18041.1 (2Fe-2S)-binding protein [Rhodopila sp.]
MPDGSSPDLLIVGAGPAGIGAALEASEAGLSVMLLDENAAPGGRIWQALERRGAKDADEDAALAAIARLRASPVDARYGATVWAIEPDLQVYALQQGRAFMVRPRTILLATGTTERPMPIIGWTLPGVMTVGAAQIALKTGGLLPDGQTWLAGQGPLMLLYANQVLDAGGKVAGVIDLSPRYAALAAAGRLSLSALPDLRKGLAWRQRLKDAGVRWIRASGVRADGDGALRSVTFTTDQGPRTVSADTLLLHDGVIPSIQMSRAVGCVHEWSAAQHCWRPVTDDWGVSSVPGILIAGDAAGIGGADVAMLSGRIAVLGLLGRQQQAVDLRARRKQRLAVRPFLDATFPPLRLTPEDATLVCRCEEVTAGAIRAAARAGCPGINQLKAYTRCGMGPCQGRTCGPIALDVLAAATGVAHARMEPLRTRFPIKPVKVGALTDA